MPPGLPCARDAGCAAPAWQTAVDIAAVTQVLQLGQARGGLGSFDARVMASVMTGEEWEAGYGAGRALGQEQAATLLLSLKE
jgi:hypothetical protein